MAISTARLARDIVFTLEKKSPEIAFNIFLNNGVLAVMGLQKRVKLVKGGNRFDERTHLGQNSTVDHRSKFAQIPTDFQNNWLTAQYGQSVISGTGIVNMVEAQQNMGKEKLDDLAEKTIEEANLTFPNKVGDALMATTSGANDPLSIVETIEATAYGAQTSTLGGIDRGDHTGVGDATDAWQNQYDSTAIADISAAAGKATIQKFYWTCSPGGSGKGETPDVGLTTTGVFAKMSGGEDALRRYSPSDRLLKLGFDSLMVNNAAIIADRNVGATNLYFLNTNYLRFQILAGNNTKTTGAVQPIGNDGQPVQSIPLQVSKAVESDDFLNWTIKMWMVYNLTVSGLRQHGLYSGIVEA